MAGKLVIRTTDNWEVGWWIMDLLDCLETDRRLALPAGTSPTRNPIVGVNRPIIDGVLGRMCILDDVSPISPRLLPDLPAYRTHSGAENDFCGRLPTVQHCQKLRLAKRPQGNLTSANYQIAPCFSALVDPTVPTDGYSMR